MTADDLDRDSGIVRIDEHKTDRTGRPRLLFLSGKPFKLLLSLAKQYPIGPLLRTAKGTPWTPKAVAWAMLKLCRRAGVKVTAYGYRHSYATDALAAGIPDAHVAELLGHSSTAMLHRHYSHLSAKTKVLAAAACRVR
jgi:integrase